MSNGRIVTGLGGVASLALGWAMDKMWSEAPNWVLYAVFGLGVFLFISTLFWRPINKGIRAMADDKSSRNQAANINLENSKVEGSVEITHGDKAAMPAHQHFDQVSNVTINNIGVKKEIVFGYDSPPIGHDRVYLKLNPDRLFTTGSSDSVTASSNVASVALTSAGHGSSEFSMSFYNPLQNSDYRILTPGHTPQTFEVSEMKKDSVKFRIRGSIPDKQIEIEIETKNRGE
jgi:hypothetical protein